VSSHNAYTLKNKANTALGSTLASVSSTLNGSQKFYRVRIGPLDNVEQADNLTERLTQKGFNAPSVTAQ
ncbi:SPOR domain-containing protein, partial [Thiolapillus sp.]|uniref:SPOR domain-containing protein n=1 Tax=Thiolapillus sp. TaxID=2017437 RepID=UPI003AF751F3